ncbi:MAG: UDP-3-O-(3-hydroxymyristoyl)glucosamine N-acyltransferase [Candidatus Omnitrophica bacterium]|nr:UDP-3-O-(3-hydroxymyristoyl)glucosamine N-acyltransferase [Candidatus Omnitrophota bacterium]
MDKNFGYNENGFNPHINLSLSKIAELIGGEIIGDSNVIIRGISGIKEAQEGDITFIANPKYLSLINTTRASAIITSESVESTNKTIVKTENPSLAFAQLVSHFSPNEKKPEAGIHSTAIIGKKVSLGKNICIQPHVVILDGASVGDDTVLQAGAYVGHHTKIGSNCVIHPHVTIRERVTIGNNVIIHSGAVIGSDGFGYATVKDVHYKIPQIGTVFIEDDVEIGANVTIDRARFGRTHIRKGTKIDNLVQIAHNVDIGENSIIVAQSGISGSTKIGKGVILAGQSGVVGHITIGDNARVAAQAGVTKSVPEGEVVSGYPAKPHSTAKRINACVQKLPDFYKCVKSLQEKIRELEEELDRLRERAS